MFLTEKDFGLNTERSASFSGDGSGSGEVTAEGFMAAMGAIRPDRRASTTLSADAITVLKRVISADDTLSDLKHIFFVLQGECQRLRTGLGEADRKKCFIKLKGIAAAIVKLDPWYASSLASQIVASGMAPVTPLPLPANLNKVTPWGTIKPKPTAAPAPGYKWEVKDKLSLLTEKWVQVPLPTPKPGYKWEEQNRMIPGSEKWVQVWSPPPKPTGCMPGHMWLYTAEKGWYMVPQIQHGYMSTPQVPLSPRRQHPMAATAKDGVPAWVLTAGSALAYFMFK